MEHYTITLTDPAGVKRSSWKIAYTDTGTPGVFNLLTKVGIEQFTGSSRRSRDRNP